MDNARGKPSNRRELLGVNDRFVHLLLFGDILADGNNVSDLGVVRPASGSC